MLRMKKLPVSNKQRYALEKLTDFQHRQILYGGGGRSGKSWLGSMWIVIKCLEFEGSAWFIGRQELKALKRTTLKTVFKFLSFIGFKKDKDYKYNGQDSTLTFSRSDGNFDGGSVIFFGELKAIPSDPEFDRLGSYDLTGAWIDECQEVALGAKDMLQTRLSLLNGTNCNGKEWKTFPKTLLTCNPAKNWIFTQFVKPNEKGLIDDDKTFIPALYKDNPFIDRDQYRETVLATGNEVKIQRLLYGNFYYDDDPNALIGYDEQCDLFTNSFVYADKSNKWITADIALTGSDKLVIGVWYGFVLKEVVEVAKSDSAEVVRLLRSIKQKHNIPHSRLIYDADGVGAFVGGFFNGAKKFVNNSKALKDENYENLKTQCYYALAKKINNYEMYLECITDVELQEYIKEELGQVKSRDTDKDGKIKMQRKEVTKQNIGRSPDYSDMLMMRMLPTIQPERRGRRTR